VGGGYPNRGLSDAPRRARGFPECAQPSDALQARWNKVAEMLPDTELKMYTPKGAYADGRPLLRPDG
jgi:hypothetical protein